MTAAPAHTHRALADCPVCGDRLVTTRLGCGSCGTELVGQFAPCPYCALDDADHELLRVFLTSRGNIKDLQAHLGVSYPTARARFNDVLARLGWLSEADAEGADEADGAEAIDEEDAAGEPDGSHSDASHASESQPAATNDAVRDQVLAQVASGQLSPAVAADLLANLR
jgi:hypothetical protein